MTRRGASLPVAGASLLALCIVAAVAGCSAPTPISSPSPSATTPTPAVTSISSATPSTLPLPPYAIDALRARIPTGGPIAVGAVLEVQPGFTKHSMTWTSGGATMTGVIDIPNRPGPHPVVLVNHGAVSVSQYYVGLDTAKYADPMAAAGFLTVAPDYPGYAGSGGGAPGVPSIVAVAISEMDLISELRTLPAADPARVAVAGHSNGGGVSLILMVADPAVRAAVLYAPVSSDMADNARRWWLRSGHGTGGLPSPDVDPAAWKLMSPRNFFSSATPPTLIMQGTEDTSIPAAWTAATVDALQAAGVRTSFVSFPGSGHIFEGADLARANALAVSWLGGALTGG